MAGVGGLVVVILVFAGGAGAVVETYVAVGQAVDACLGGDVVVGLGGTGGAGAVDRVGRGGADAFAVCEGLVAGTVAAW